MYDYKRMLIIEHGQLGIIQDTDGNRVTFESLEDMSRCCEMDFTQKFYVGYEPENNFYADSRDPELQPENDNTDKMPVQAYEDLIAMIPTLQARKADITWGLTGAELTAAQDLVAQIAALQARVAELEAAQEADSLHKYTPDQVKNYIDNQFALVAGDNAATVDLIKTILKRIAVYTLR